MEMGDSDSRLGLGMSMGDATDRDTAHRLGLTIGDAACKLSPGYTLRLGMGKGDADSGHGLRMRETASSIGMKRGDTDNRQDLAIEEVRLGLGENGDATSWLDMGMGDAESEQGMGWGDSTRRLGMGLGDTDSGLRVSKGDAASRLGLGMGDEQPDQAGLKWGQDRAEHMSSKPEDANITICRDTQTTRQSPTTTGAVARYDAIPIGNSSVPILTSYNPGTSPDREQAEQKD